MDSDLIKQLTQVRKRIGETEVRETPVLFLPWAQRALNPFPLASSGTIWGDQGIPWPVSILAFYCSIFVVTTNNATNFWTIALSATPGGAAVASFNTSAVAAGAFNRFSDLTITQPATTDIDLFITPTATLNPGAIFIVPAVALLRT